MKKTAMAAALAALAALAACGGGGSDAGGPGVVVPDGLRSVGASAGSDVSATNFEAVAAPAIRAVLRSASAEQTGLGAGREAPQRRAAGSAPTGPATWSLVLLEQALAGTARERAAAVQTIGPEPCDFGGTMTLTIDDADNNNRLSAGDSMTIASQHCVAYAGAPAVSGVLAMHFNAVELDRDQMPTAMDVSATATQLSVAGLGAMDGPFRLWQKPIDASSDRMRVRYDATSVSEPGGQTVVYDFDVYGVATATGGSFSLNGGIGIGGQVYALVGIADFAYTDGTPPGTGALRVRDAAGDAVQLSARTTGLLDLDFFPNGATAAQASSPGRAWSEFNRP